MEIMFALMILACGITLIFQMSRYIGRTELIYSVLGGACISTAIIMILYCIH